VRPLGRSSGVFGGRLQRGLPLLLSRPGSVATLGEGSDKLFRLSEQDLCTIEICLQRSPLRNRLLSARGQLLEVEHMVRQDRVVFVIRYRNMDYGGDEPDEPDGIGPDAGNRLAGGRDLFYVYARC